MRPSRRQPDEMRAISFERDVSKHAEGSCLVKFGDTHVLCTASLEEKVPGWLRNSGRGWVTAECGMLRLCCCSAGSPAWMYSGGTVASSAGWPT